MAFLCLLISYPPAQAFDSVDAQIDHYLRVLNQGSTSQKVEMLKQLQWSGLTDPRLYDPIEAQVRAQYLSKNLDKNQINVAAHAIRALGYSGNDKYRETLAQVQTGAGERKLRSHAKKALIQLEKFNLWNMKIGLSDYPVEGKDVQTATYMKMLAIDDFAVQRLAARAIFHQYLRDPDMIALAAQKLEQAYAQPGLSKDAQDTVAWLCKAVGRAGPLEHGALLRRVAADSPYKKVRKHAQKYAN